MSEWYRRNLRTCRRVPNTRIEITSSDESRIVTIKGHESRAQEKLRVRLRLQVMLWVDVFKTVS